jgi:DNA-binding response OmpR family regulator
MDQTSHAPKVLIVDDEVALAQLYALKLRDSGINVEECNDGESALQLARQFKPDLILLDLMMPRLSGFDAIELFRSTPETSASKIVIMSALSQPEDIARTKELGADDYIVKGDSTIKEVVARLKNHLGMEETTSGMDENTPPAPLVV